MRGKIEGKVSVLSSDTHHFKTAGSHNQVVNDVVDLGDQRQDGRLGARQEELDKVFSISDYSR